MDNRNIIFFLAGTIVGAGSMYLALEKRFAKMLDQEVLEAKKYYELKFEESETVNEKVEEPIVKNDDIKLPEEEKNDEPDYDGIIEKLNYNQFSTKTTNKIAEKPYIISTDQYNNDVEFDKLLLSYFSEDEVLIDAQTDEVIDDIGKIVGFDNLEQLCMIDDGEVFIRNEREGCDYRVILETGTYDAYLSEE